MSCLGRSPTRHTTTILDVHMEVQLFHLPPPPPPPEVRFGRSVVKGLPHAVGRGSLKLGIVFDLPRCVTACRGLAISA